VVVVVAEVEVEVVVVALVAVEALGGVPQGMAVVLPMGPLPLPTAVLVVDTAMDVSSLHTSQPPVLLCCPDGLHAASTSYICHIHMCVLLYSAEIVHSFPTCVCLQFLQLQLLISGLFSCCIICRLLLRTSRLV